MRLSDRKISVIRRSMAWKGALLFFGAWGLLDGSGILKGKYTPNFPHMFTNVSNLFAWGYFALALLKLARQEQAQTRAQAQTRVQAQTQMRRMKAGLKDTAGAGLKAGVPAEAGAAGNGMSAAGAGEGTGVFAPTAKYTATISLLVTMLIAHFMLFDAMFKDGHIVLHLVWMHYVVPCMALLDWLFFDEKGKMPLWGPFAWMSLVVGYLVFTFIAVGVFDVYMGGGTTEEVTKYPYTFLDPAIAGPGGVASFCGAMLAAFLLLGYLLFAVDRLLARRG